MKIKNKMAVMGAAAGFALSLSVLPLMAADTTQGHMSQHQRLGRIEKTQQVIGSDIKNQQGQTLGKIDHLLVDLESGHILYAVALVDGSDFAIAPESLSASGARSFTLNADKQKLTQAPRVNKDRAAQMADVNFVSSVYQYWNQQPWWQGAAQPTGRTTFGNVHKLSELKGMTVKNSSNQDLGKVEDVAIDLPAGRVTFVVLNPGGILEKKGDMLYALPPNALTLGPDQKTLDRKSTRLNSSHVALSRMPSSA